MELTIEKLVYGGDGLGRLPEGEVLFVPWSAPGDRLEVARVPGAQKPAKALIETVLSPAPERVTPRCSVFGDCGGCQWQHLSGSAQRDWKRQIVLESVQRLGKLENVPVLETLGDDTGAWQYRNRAQWEIELAGETFAADAAYQLGYHAAQSHTVVPFERCDIIPDPLNALALWLRQWVRDHRQAASGLLRIEALINQAGQLLLLLAGEKNEGLLGLAQSLPAAFPALQGVAFQESANPRAVPTTLSGEPFLTESLGGHTFRISTGSFFQTNLSASARILETLENWLLPEAHTLLDVYAGVGLFAIHFHRRFHQVVAVESAPGAVKDAEANLALNGVSNVTLRKGDARTVLGHLNATFDAAIVDPPRAGCPPEVLGWLARHVKRQILYVSCNPATLARDLKTLTAAGWRTQAIQPIDMFPQTYHIECVANLVRH